MIEALVKRGSFWIWKNDKDEYQAFLVSLNDIDKRKVVDHESLHEVNVFAATFDLKKTSWSDVYRSSN